MSCGICRKKETSGSLMELHPPYVIKEHILQTLHDWHSMSFLDFIDSLFVMVFFEKEWYISSYASIYFPFLIFFSTFFAKGIPSEKLLQGFAGG